MDFYQSAVKTLQTLVNEVNNNNQPRYIIRKIPHRTKQRYASKFGVEQSHKPYRARPPPIHRQPHTNHQTAA